MKVLAWPLAVIIISCIFFIIFRRSIAGLLGRTSEIGRKGLKTMPEQSQKLADTNKTPTEELMETFNSQIIREREVAIQTYLETRSVSSNNDKIKVLTRHLAIVQLFSSFEKTYNLIYGSQVCILEELNEKRLGVLKEDIKRFYDDGEIKWPQFFLDYSFDAYLNFLKTSGIITEKDGCLFITNYGVEFLEYLARTGRSNARFRFG